MNTPPTKQVILERLEELASECEQICRDITAWNMLHPKVKPFDCEGERVAATHARQAIEHLNAGRMDEFNACWGTCFEYIVQNFGPTEIGK